jgi:UDP-N-acetylmuramoylalanine--D-glutamate ligase
MRFGEMENTRVAILGVGREGQAVWRQIRRRYPEKHIALFSESAVNEEFRQELHPAHDALTIGPLSFTELRQFDLLVRSAGISIYRDELKDLRAAGVKFTSASSLWFAENPEAKTICITGTLGKSTTATLTAQLLARAGVNVCLAGNIGMPMLDCNDVDADWWVIELSSYQISDLEAEPDIAVLLNISEEHLDWHEGIDNYIVDKIRLARLASKGRVIANYSDKTLLECLKGFPDVAWFNKAGYWQADRDRVYRLPGETGLTREQFSAPVSLPGEHNMQNLAAALTVVEAVGAEVPRSDELLPAYRGLPHRLQFIGEKNGIRYVNDSISTTPVSVGAALNTIENEGVVLLLGGMDRGLDWSGFARSITNGAPHAIITMPDSGRRVLDSLRTAGVELKGGLHAVSGLKQAVMLAEKLVPEKGCILLSPGAPSFPQFRDFADRGEQFTRYSGFNRAPGIEK